MTLPLRSERRRLSSRRGGCCLAWASLFCNVLMVRAAPAAIAPGGEIAITSEAIYHGLSESFGRPALEADLHATTSGGTFAGVYTIDTFSGASGGAKELAVYLGQRVALGSDWSAQLTAYDHHYLSGSDVPGDYAEIAAQMSYLDLWSISITAIPDATGRPHTVPGGAGMSYREHYSAWVAATQLQWLITSRLFFTAGGGYYFVQDVAERTGSADTYSYLSGRPGYPYGSLGLSCQWRQWRIDAAYFLTGQRAAAAVYPYPSANQHVAATLSWRF
jgi:hypothetical protein